MPTDIDTLWNYPDPAGSEAKFLAVLPEAEAAGDVSYLAELLTQIARAQGLQRRYDDARASLDRAAALISSARLSPRSISPTLDSPEMIVPRIRLALERGRVFNDTLQTADAKACFIEAWELGRAHRGSPKVDLLAVDAIHMIAIVEPPLAAIEWNLQALTYAAANADAKVRGWQWTLRNNLGWAYSSSGHYVMAAEVFESLMNDHVREGRENRAGVARWCWAKNLRLIGRFDQALEIQRQIQASLGDKMVTDGYCNEELGECLLAFGRDEEAKSHFAIAYRVLSNDPWFPPTEAARLERMKQLGKT